MNPKGQNLTSEINYQYGANNSPNNFVQDFMGLDEFFEMTTAAAASAERNGSCDGYSDTFGSSAESQSSLASCGVRRRAVSLNSAPFDIEKQIQEIPEMDETCAESSRTIAGDGGADAYSDRGTGARRQRTNSLSAERTSSCSSPSKDNDKGKDKKYWDRRVKNNMAAKRSRDAKRLREISVVERWNFLEEENKRLKKEISDMQERTQKLESVLGHTHENSEQ